MKAAKKWFDNQPEPPRPLATYHEDLHVVAGVDDEGEPVVLIGVDTVPDPQAGPTADDQKPVVLALSPVQTEDLIRALWDVFFTAGKAD